MERNQRDRSQIDQKQQREKLQGGSKGDVDQERSRKATEQQKQGGQQGGQGIPRDVPGRSGEQGFGFERQGTTNPGKQPGQGQQTTSPRQTGLGESARTGSPGQRSS